MRRRVSIFLVPLIGLGSDQVAKATVPDHNVEAYHIDEHKGPHAYSLRQRLQNLDDDEVQYTTILIFINPQSIKRDPNNPKAGWFSTLSDLAEAGYISLLCIDEAHTVEQCGRSFRPEFLEAVANLKLIRDKMKTPCPLIAMSATFRPKDQDRISKLLCLENPAVLARPLDRRDIMWTTIVSGDPMKTIKSQLEKNLKHDPNSQVLLYSNSKTNAEGALFDTATALLESHSKRTKQPMTYADAISGGDGIKKKTYSMDCYGMFSTLSDDFDPDDIHDIFNLDANSDEKPLPLPKNQVVCGTSAINAGMSSNDLKHCKHKGMPPNLYELVQEMGRVNRLLLGLPGTNTFEVHVSVDSHASLFVRIMSGDVPSERKQLLGQMQEVLVLLFDPAGDCYHLTVESHFELQQQQKPPCQFYCSNCLGTIKQQTGIFYKRKVISILATKIFSGGKTTHYKAVIKAIKENKAFIFHENHIPKTKMGPIHALVLQLLAKGILALGVLDMTKIGKKEFSAQHVSFTLPNATDGDGILMPAYMMDERWAGMNYL